MRWIDGLGVYTEYGIGRIGIVGSDGMRAGGNGRTGREGGLQQLPGGNEKGKGEWREVRGEE